MTVTIPVQKERAMVGEALSRQQLFEELYETAFPAVARFVQQMGGSFNEASDVFQDAVIIFYEKYTAGRLTVNTSFQAYLLGIAKHLWVRRFKSKRQLVSFDDFERTLDIPEEEPSAFSVRRLILLLEQSGQNCMNLLKAFYYDKLAMNQIQKRFGYGSERSATVQKFKCIEKLRNVVKSKELSYEDFLD